MKKILISLLILLIVTYAQAQDTASVNVLGSKIVEVNENPDNTEVSLLNNKINIRDNYDNDTTNIRLWHKNIEIIEGESRTNINFNRDKDWDDEWEWKKHKRFNGHWSGFELGVNGLYNPDYSMYANPNNEFMELNQPKSLEVNLNFVEYNICIKEDRVGLVTGMGFSINNYKFDNPLTIDKNAAGLIEAVPLDGSKFDKSKLTVSYLTVPLMLEFQIPTNGHSDQLFISGGMVGGINLGSHTKVKLDNSKTKDRGSFNINPFKYSAIARIGLKDISLYATYSLSPLFKDDKGPELFPFSIGIALVNF